MEIHITKSLDESLGDRIIDTCIYTSVDAKGILQVGAVLLVIDHCMCCVCIVVDVGKKVFMAQAPARIDLMGGWSDTPPICYEFGGAVSVLLRLTYFSLPIMGLRACLCRCSTWP